MSLFSPFSHKFWRSVGSTEDKEVIGVTFNKEYSSQISLLFYIWNHLNFNFFLVLLIWKGLDNMRGSRYSNECNEPFDCFKGRDWSLRLSLVVWTEGGLCGAGEGKLTGISPSGLALLTGLTGLSSPDPGQLQPSVQHLRWRAQTLRPGLGVTILPPLTTSNGLL